MTTTKPPRQNPAPPQPPKRTSMYSRQLAVMIALIALCLSMLGAGFMALTYRYHQEESRETLERNLETISRYANAAFDDGLTLSTPHLRSYITSVAMISNSTILLCDAQGTILFAAGNSLPEEAALVNAAVPSWAINEILTDMTYSGTTTFNGLLANESFVSGVSIVSYPVDPISGDSNQRGEIVGFLFLAADASSLLNFMRNMFQLFLITALAVMLLSLVICSVAVQRIIDPIKGMSRGAHAFAHGEVDTRFTQYAKRTDEIGELAVAFNAMADSLAQAEKKRSEFVANVSHELKTPMTTIAGFAEGILDGTIPPEKEKESLQIISSETRRLSRLVRRMLELSRLQSSDRVAAQEQFDAAEVLLQVLISLEAKITEKDLDVQVDLPEGPVMVWGDPDAVTQVCYNLLDNAAKFATPKGKLTLSITTRGGKAYVSVGNDGETIPQEQLDHIFDRFHKTDSSRSSHKEGVGLGLYIVKTLLNTYKEDITVTSEDGFTQFTFTLSEV